MSKTLLPFTIITYEYAMNLAKLISSMTGNVSNDKESLQIIEDMRKAKFEDFEDDDSTVDDWDMTITASYEMCSKELREFACAVVYDSIKKDVMNRNLKEQKLKKQKLEELKNE